MKTRIFADYQEFLRREDRSENGVSQEFADANHGWDLEQKNESCWNCSDCSDCSGCSDCSDCSDCSRCSDCSDCSDCSRCSGCSGLSKSAPQKLGGVAAEVPVIPNVHQSVLAAIKSPGNSLDMSTWHSCQTTHCRAGWVVTLAGNAGKQLEERTSTEFAAMQIYRASSPIRVSPVRFYESDPVAMADIERCAEEETAVTK